MEITDIEIFLDYFERVRERTRRVAAVIPPEHLEWARHPDAAPLRPDLRRGPGSFDWRPGG